MGFGVKGCRSWQESVPGLAGKNGGVGVRKAVCVMTDEVSVGPFRCPKALSEDPFCCKIVPFVVAVHELHTAQMCGKCGENHRNKGLLHAI